MDAIPNFSSLPPAPAGHSGWPWQALDAASGGVPSPAAWPRITIVTPSYNQAAYVEQTLRSVLLQSYPNLEYLVMDGGSQDGSAAIIERYAPWLAGWVSEPDRGQSHAINKGLANATGEIFGWLNSDDIYLPGTLHAIARAFAEHPQAVLVHGDARHIAPEGALLSNQPCARPYDRKWLLEHSNLVPQPAAFFRAEAFRRAGGLDESLHYCMDWDLWLRLGAEQQNAFVPQVLAHMRIYPEAKFQSGGRRLHAELEQVLRRHGASGLPLAVRQQLVEQHLALAAAAFGRGDAAAGEDELAYALQHAPERRSNALWVGQALAEEAWRLFMEQGTAPIPLAQLAADHLPQSLADPHRAGRHLLGLLHEALALHYHRQGQVAAARRHAWQAVRAERRQWSNRGLWSIGVRSLVPRRRQPALRK